jgi:16S rRNA (cytosine967-C5)-methyltransferase
MKIHRPIAALVVAALNDIFAGGYQADRVLERLFKQNRKLGSRDRRFIAESTYDIVRWWRLLWAGLGRAEPSLETDELWRLLGAWLAFKNMEFPEWPELREVRARKVMERIEKARAENPAVRESVPDWLFEMGASEFGIERWLEILPALNVQAPVVLRANRLRITRDELRTKLLAETIDTKPAPRAPDGLVLTARKNVFSTECFRGGLFEVQDGASQQIAPMLDPKPGDRVIDACAGAGGKTLHLAAMMKNKGKIIALDVNERRLEELKKRCARDGVDIAEARVIESGKTIKRLEETADRVLLDVPCSGLGVLRRNPDAKWKMKKDEIDRLRTLQAEILTDYSKLVKKGGRLVYATCSILPSENEKQVERFLASDTGRGWTLVEEKRFWPNEDGYDGFYAAALERPKA